MIRTLVFWIRLSLGVAGFLAAVVWLMCLRLFRQSNARSRQRFARTMSRLACPPLGVRLHITGTQHIEAQSPCIYVANHQSYIDYPIAGAVFPANAVILARVVGELPVLGTLFRSTGNITVDRDVPTRAAAALAEAQRAVVERGNSVWIFAEGTRGKQAGRIAPFKRGAFRLAVATGIPIVPVVISTLKPRTDLRARQLQPQRVDIHILEPISAARFGPVNEQDLREHVHALMQRTLDRSGTLASTQVP